MRNAGLIVAPLLPALVLGVAALLPPTPGVWSRVALRTVAAVGILATAAASTALALVREPIRDRYCWNDCTLDAFLVGDDVELARRLTSIVLALAAASAILAALVAVVRLGRRSGDSAALRACVRRCRARRLRACRLCRHAPLRARGSFPTAGSTRLSSSPGASRSSCSRRRSPGSRCGRRSCVAGSRAWRSIWNGRPRPASGPLLARTLGDPGLRLGYPVGTGSRIVDADGRALAFDDARRVTTLVTGDEVVALVESDVTSVGALEHELGPAVRLALGNERLRLEALARLEDVTRSRARIVRRPPMWLDGGWNAISTTAPSSACWR